jgi:type IX secretion system PorP/SprF family membrane protein
MDTHILRIIWITGVLVAMAGKVAYSQQQAMFTQYMFNGLAINPAYAGSQESLSLTALARQQWTGLEGSPSTQTLSAHSPIKSEKVALGALFINDKIGIIRQTGFQACYAYRIQMRKGTLSLGLQGGFTNFRSEYSTLFVQDPNDPYFKGNDVNQFLPNFGTGAYYYSERFYVGFSVPQLVSNYYKSETANSFSSVVQVRHYFLTGGYVFDINPSLKLKPSLLLKAVEGAPLALDLNANLLLKEVVWLGLSYRSFQSLSALLELQLTDQFRLGYAYDFSTSSPQKGLTYGSHELMLNYRFAYAKTKVITPRYF